MSTHIICNLQHKIKHNFSILHLLSLTLLTIPQSSSSFHSRFMFWPFPVGRLLWFSWFCLPESTRIVDTELCRPEFHHPFIFPTHILIHIYHLLRTLLMPPFFSHFTTLPPSVFFFSPAFLSFLNIHGPSLVFAPPPPHPLPFRMFYMLTISLFLLSVFRL